MRSLVSFLFVMIAGSAAQAATVTFRDVATKDEEHLKRNLPKLLQADVDLATLDAAIRELMTRGYYENVYVERTPTGNYEIIGKPLRVIEEIKFTGVHDVPEAELRALMDFKSGDRFDRKRAVAAGEKMKNYYGEHGFFNTVIELGFQKTESKNIRLVYDIQEKPACRIRGLEFETPNTDLKDLLNAGFKRELGKPLTTERVRRVMQNLESLLIERRYLAAEVTGPDARYNPDKSEAYLLIEVRDPYRFEFYFEGNTFFTTGDVYSALDLKNRERKNVDPASEGAERLRRSYLAKGFPSIQIETKVVNPPGTFLKRIYYTINEGPRVRIQNIEVIGRVSRASSYYEDFILKNSSDLISDDFYNRQDLETGFKNLITELRNQGYLRARVLSSRVEYNEAKTKVTVFLTLDEGPQTQIRSIDFIGNKFFSSFELAEVTELDTNTPLKLIAFEESLQKLKDFYHRQGFMEMKLLNENAEMIKYNDKGTQARITYQIFEGPRIRVHSIVVEGNSLTHTHVILKEAGFELGEVLTPQKIDEATLRLRKMGLFSRVDVHTLEEGTNISERTLIIGVTEGMPGDVRIGGGVTNERNLTLRGYTGASYNNLWGTARAISGRALISSNVAKVRYPENEIQLGYLEPFLFDTRTRGRINLTRKDYVYDYEERDIKNREVNFTEITIKNRLDLFVERDLTSALKLTYKAWSLESRTNYERYSRCLPEPDSTDPLKRDFNIDRGKCEANVMQVATTGPQLDLDYRDNPFLPTKGSFTRWTFDYSNPSIGSSQGVEFYKTDLEHRRYIRLGSPNWVWANSMRSGYLKNLNNAEGNGVPSDYVFVLGGINTVRGFDLSSPNERIPRDKSDADQLWTLGTTNTKIPMTDSYYFLVKTELRYPIYGNLGGVVFYDGGAVFVSGYKFDRTYQDAAGFGLRWNTPVGPAALDVAFKLHPMPPIKGSQDKQSQYRVQISVGTF